MFTHDRKHHCCPVYGHVWYVISAKTTQRFCLGLLLKSMRIPLKVNVVYFYYQCILFCNICMRQCRLILDNDFGLQCFGRWPRARSFQHLRKHCHSCANIVTVAHAGDAFWIALRNECTFCARKSNAAQAGARAST